MAEPIDAGELLQCNVVDCRPPPEPAAEPVIPKEAQAVDYMAKDFDSFQRAMLDLLPSRAPGWADRTEADLGMAIVELLAYLGDQLSYYQDRVAHEAFLRTATQYDSVRKLLSLIDYRPDLGSAARAHLAVEAAATHYLPAGFAVRTEGGEAWDPVVFETVEALTLDPKLNKVALAADAPATPDGKQVVLAAELGGEFLPIGSWLYLEAGPEREWARVAAPVRVDSGTLTTTVVLAAPLQGRYPAGQFVRGNGVPATHGQSRVQTAVGTGRPGQAIPLEFAPLTYTRDASGVSHSTLRVEVAGVSWSQVEDFIESEAADAHYRLSRDNQSFTTVHFGDGTRGRVPEAGALIKVSYRNGIGESGLVGANTITRYHDPDDHIASVTNPLPSSGAVEPQSTDEARLLGPRQLRRQERAVVPADYERVLMEGVRLGGRTVTPLHAKARHRWTGSWTTVFVSIDMPERIPLADQPGVREVLEDALAAKRLAGCDVRVEDARYAPLHIALVIQVNPGFFARYVRRQVERALGSRENPDGTLGFFAPGRFSFGQDVFLSDLYAAAMAVQGVESLAVRRFKRLGDRHPDREKQGFIPIDPLEIARCDSDPAHPENGILFIRTRGGKEG